MRLRTFSGTGLSLHGRNEEIARQLARLPVYLTFVLVENDTICDELGAPGLKPAPIAQVPSGAAVADAVVRQVTSRMHHLDSLGRRPPWS